MPFARATAAGRASDRGRARVAGAAQAEPPGAPRAAARAALESETAACARLEGTRDSSVGVPLNFRGGGRNETRLAGSAAAGSLPFVEKRLLWFL